MSRAFISYAHVSPDQDLATKLSSALEASGLTVFVDSKIRLGQDWAEQIDRQLRSAQFFVVLLSAASITSDMVRREIALAYKLKKAHAITILPVRIGFEGELPYEIGAYLDLIQYTVWRPGESFDPISRAILRAMSESGDAMPAPAAAHTARFDPAALQRIEDDLAFYIGPLARVILERAAKKAMNWQQLYEIVSAEVPAADRKKFLASRAR
ncbi:MAG: toll/interleukin-1 receptor domain-containing protein [Bryobacteraceae bacterium]